MSVFQHYFLPSGRKKTTVAYGGFWHFEILCRIKGVPDTARFTFPRRNFFQSCSLWKTRSMEIGKFAANAVICSFSMSEIFPRIFVRDKHHFISIKLMITIITVCIRADPLFLSIYTGFTFNTDLWYGLSFLQYYHFSLLPLRRTRSHALPTRSQYVPTHNPIH